MLWVVLLLMIWVALAWYIACQNFNHEFDALVATEQRNAEETSKDVADSIKRNLYFVAGIPDTLQNELHVKKALEQFGKSPQPASLTQAEAIKIWTTDPDLMALNKHLESVQRSLGIDLILVVNAAGDCISSSNWNKPGVSIGINLADRQWFDDARTWYRGMQYAVGKTTHVAGLYFSTPVVLDGQFKGAIVAKVGIPALSFLTRHADAYVVDANGVIIMAHDPEIRMMAVHGAKVASMGDKEKMSIYQRKDFPELKIESWGGPHGGRLKRINREDFPHVLVSNELTEYGMTVYAASDLPALPAMEHERRNAFLLMSALGSGLILLVGGLILYFQSIVRAKNTAEENEARLRRLLESVGGGIWGQSKAGLCTFINAAAAKMLGYRPDELLGKPMHSVVHHSHPDGARYPQQACPMYATCQDGVPRIKKDEVLWCRDGSSLPVEYSTHPMYREGRLEGVVVVFEDITERLRSEPQALR